MGREESIQKSRFSSNMLKIYKEVRLYYLKAIRCNKEKRESHTQKTDYVQYPSSDLPHESVIT